MAITQAFCNSFRQELLQGTHDLGTGGDALKIALFTSSATLNASTTTYGTANEATGTGYTAGGATLTNSGVTLSNGKAIADFADVTWSGSTITARGSLIYNSSTGNKAICVLDFGVDKSSSSSDFTIIFPTADSSNGIIRLS